MTDINALKPITMLLMAAAVIFTIGVLCIAPEANSSLIEAHVSKVVSSYTPEQRYSNPLTGSPNAAKNQAVKNLIFLSVAQKVFSGRTNISEIFFVLTSFANFTVILFLLTSTNFIAVIRRKGLSVLALSIGGNSPPSFHMRYNTSY